MSCERVLVGLAWVPIARESHRNMFWLVLTEPGGTLVCSASSGALRLMVTTRGHAVGLLTGQ